MTGSRASDSASGAYTELGLSWPECPVNADLFGLAPIPGPPRCPEMSHLVPGGSRGDKHDENTFFEHQPFDVRCKDDVPSDRGSLQARAPAASPPHPAREHLHPAGRLAGRGRGGQCVYLRSRGLSVSVLPGRARTHTEAPDGLPCRSTPCLLCQLPGTVPPPVCVQVHSPASACRSVP